MIVPEKVVLAALRARRAQSTFLTAEAGQARIEELALRPTSYGPPRRLRRDVTVTAGRRHGWPSYVVTPAGAAPRGAVVYAHGGGWVSDIVAEHWHLVAQVAAEARTTVVVPIYPLVPFGTAEEVVAGFVDVVRESQEAYGDTRLAGDSAGGQIALSAALELRDRHDVRLSRTVLISPAVDLTWSNPQIPVVQPTDPWLAVPGGRVRSEAWRGALDVEDQRVSPLYADLAGLGPLTVFQGTRDILHPDAMLLVDKARAAGVEVDLHVGEGQVHVFPLLPTAAGRDARRVVVDQLRLG